MAQSKIIGAVEIGTSKVVVLVGEVTDGRSLNIIGRGQSTSMGVRKGEIIDIQSVSGCTHAALNAAEKNAGAQIEYIYLAKSGRHLDGFSQTGITAISSSDNIVSADDVWRATENAKDKALPAGRLYIHHIRTGFFLDGRPVDKPVGMRGSQLEAHYWHVHADERRVSDHLHVINAFGLNVQDMIVSSIACGSVLTHDVEKRQGVMVVDIGAGTTDYALYRNGRIVRTGVIPIGGDHLTNDLSIGLRVGAKFADNLKLRYGKAIIDKEDKGDSVLLVGDLTIGDRPIPRLSIYKIMNARLEELFMMLKNKLGSAVSAQNLPGGVILTGGVAKTPYICELAGQILGVEARRSESPGWVVDPELCQPEYAAAVGLLYYGLRGQQTEEEMPVAARKGGGILKKVSRLFS